MFELNKRSIFYGVVLNVFLGLSIFQIFLSGFRAGIFLYFVHYFNYVLPEPLRFYSMFIFPATLGLAIVWWKYLLPIGVEWHGKYLKKFFGKWEVFDGY